MSGKKRRVKAAERKERKVSLLAGFNEIMLSQGPSPRQSIGTAEEFMRGVECNVQAINYGLNRDSYAKLRGIPFLEPDALTPDPEPTRRQRIVRRLKAIFGEPA